MTPALGQVVESDPNPVRTDQSVTITFYADRGNGGLEDCDCDVYAHTGLITEESTDDSDWKYVMDNWPENRELTKLEQVDPNTYELTIPDIRDYYSKNRTGAGDVPPKSEEEIKKLAFVFRNSDGSKTGKTEGGGDIFVEVNDVGQKPFLETNILSPSANPPLYPFMTARDTTVDVTITADTANVDSLDTLRLFVDGQLEDSTTTDSLTYPLPLTQPNRFQIRGEATASTADSTLTDTLETFAIRTPNVTEEARPSDIQDGINYNSDGSVTLSLNAPNKNFAYVLGDFNDWEIDSNYFMKKDGDHWWITLSATEIRDQKEYAFQYFVDGEHRIADPLSHKILQPVDRFISDQTYPNLKAYPDSVTENPVSVLEKGRPDFNFDNPDFTPPPRDELVVYELLLRDFLKQGNFQTLTDTLDYLDRLGVNAIELMPVSSFYGNNSWGYNPLFHLALEKSYGTRTAFKEFVQAAHNRDIAVIMDVVYNHIDTPSPLRQLYGSADESPFLESGSNRGICGGFFEELNQENMFIQDYIDRANEYWIEEFNVDGFRFDLAKCVADNGIDINDPGHSNAVVSGWKAVSDSMWAFDPDTYMILEFFGSPSEENELGGYRDDDGNRGSMMTWHNMNRPYSEADMGYVGGTSGFGSGLRDAYFGNRRGYDQPSYIAYMESHDEQWLMRRKKAFGRGSDSTSYSTKDFETALDRQKLSAAFYFTVPGPRMTWQFAEVGYGWGPDECLKESSACSASDPGRTAPKPIRWEYADSTQSPSRHQVYKAWQALLRLRDNHEVFSAPRTGSGESIDMRVADGDVVRWITLEDENLDALVVGNFGVNVRSATLDVPQTGTWYNFFENDTLQANSVTQSFQLRPGEFRIYTSKEQASPPMGLVPSAPRYRATTSVSADQTYDFGDTGVDVNFSGTSGAGEVTIEKLNESPLAPDSISESNISQYRFVIGTTGDLGFDNQTEVRFDVSTLDRVSTSDADSVVVYRRPTEDVGAFTELMTSYNSDSDELVAQADSLGEFVLASTTAPLPVELTGFSARLTDSRTVQLTWQTASEKNNAGFQVQRRGTGAEAESWTDVSFVEGAGTSDATQTYRVADEVPFEADVARYRLKQVDTDGSAQFSRAVTVELGVPDEVRLSAPYPNPATDQATVRYAVPSRRQVRLELFDVLGRKVRTLALGPQEGRQQQRVDVSSLSNGTYILRLRAGSAVQTRRLTVVQ